jgi:flagellar motor switch protein FliG
MNGSQKAAALLVQLGTTRAAKVLRNMTEVEVIELMTQVAALPQLDDDTVDSVVQDFSLGLAASRSISQGGLDQARALLTERLGARQAESVLEQLGAGLAGNPLKFLDSVDPQQIAAFVGEEHPQLVSVIIAHLPLDSAAAVLGEFEAARGADIAARVANMGRISPDVLNQTADLVRRKLAALLSNEQAFATGGVDALVGILNHSDRATEKRIIGDLELQDPALAERVRAQLFVFDDIGGIDDRTMQRILRNVVPGDLAVALKTASADVRNKFLANMSERAAVDVRDEMDTMGPVRVSTVEAAQTGIVRVIRELEAAGEVTLARGNNDDPMV